ncbi:GumC family protein [Sphingoaurantiacus capsulatus]|uniref:non-specific protein-tyrosine kinase n=1 Tax=Sphingoaurantiacus capsulatus TaxID=1771310 RepID=A0ABV7XE48_9SPHN
MATIAAAPPAPLVDRPDPGLDLGALIGILRRRWQLIGAITLSVVLLATLTVYQLTPRYAAMSAVAVQTQKTQVVDIQDVVSDMAPDTATMETQASILRSSALMGKLIDRLKLDQDPEFNPAVEAAQGNFDLLKPASWFGERQQYKAPVEPLARARERTRITQRVRKAIEISVVPRSYVVEIRAISEDPEKAASMANSLADLYISDQIEAKYEATRRASGWLEERVAELRDQAVAADRAVELYRIQYGLVGGVSGGVDSQQLSEINSQLILARSERAAKEAQLSQVRQLVAGGGANIETSGAIIDSPLIQRLREQESEVVRKLAELQATYGERHPRIINATAELRDLRSKIGDEVRKIAASTANEVSVARAREGALSSSLSGLRGRVGASGQAEVRLRELQREADSTKTLYETFLNRYKETREQVDVQTADARIIAPADVPVNAAYPRKTLTVGLALLVGLIAGAALAFALEKLDNTVRGADLVERIGGGSVLTFVPIVSGKYENPEDVIIERPQSMVAESIRTLQGALSLIDVDDPPKVIMLTSSVPAEGKTFISTSLARVFAQSGKKVILVDADMRHPRLHKALELSNEAGLVQVLSGKGQLADVIRKDPKTEVQVLTAGVGAPNPADLLRSQRMEQLLGLLREHYDLVIVDTPPFVPMTDSQNVARLVDAMLLVVRWGETPAQVVTNTLRQVRKLGVPFTGTVLSQVDMDRHAQYGYGDYGYHYSKYGAYYGAKA